MGGHDRLEPEPGGDECGREIGSRSRGLVDDESVALRDDPGDSVKAPQDRFGSHRIVDLDVDGPGGTDQFTDGALGDEAALVHHDHVRAGLFDFAEMMAGQQDGRALLGESRDQRADLADLTRVQTVGRFVEHQELGA